MHNTGKMRGEFMYYFDQLKKIGISTIDEQHSKWIDMMKFLIELRNQDEQSSKVIEVVNEMYNYARTHFAYEENLFYKNDYPLAAEHILQHKEFLKSLENFRVDIEKGNIPITNLLLATMKSWLIDHINVEDQKYADFFKQKESIQL